MEFIFKVADDVSGPRKEFSTLPWKVFNPLSASLSII